jgi:hypothetical protein
VSGSAVAQDSRELFRVGAASYSIRDVFDAASFRGDLERPWREFLRKLGCEKQAMDDGRDSDDDAIDSAVQSFRYDYDLITAEETERWLADRGLTLGDFGDFFTRRFWGEVVDIAEPEPVDHYSAPAETRELFIPELILSGDLGKLAVPFSWRLAAAAAGEAPPDAERVQRARDEFAERLKPQSLTDWQLTSGRDEAWIDQMASLEANFCLHRERLLTPQEFQRELVTLRMALTVFELEVIELDSRDAAREALLCVKEDSMSMEEVARDGRYPFRHERVLLQDIPPDAQQPFLSANAGELMDPVEQEGAHRLCRVVSKKEPDPNDPEVRRRIEQRILARHFNELSNRFVDWQIALS